MGEGRAESSSTEARAAAGASPGLLRELARPWNLMSLVRLPLAIAVLAAREHLAIVLGLMVLAALSDALDGAMARRAGAGSAIGAWLDPVCDKAFVLALLIAIWVVQEPPWWLLALSAVREMIVVPMVLAHLLAPGRAARRIEYRARPSGKATTVAQFVVIGAVLFGRLDVAVPASIAAATIGLWAGVEYALRARHTMGRPA
jgi:cardiolipin synthase